ncbi:unknown protein [Waddlia chondrophila 2032/99]|uniref:Uncharacterized protein n=1 Tax=Waddlia chondrophila 2032/99 TaxID=765953 RepID=F8LFC5_9BACT|nr:unknown protein [Waddlia chondrophila 2032/99]
MPIIKKMAIEHIILIRLPPYTDHMMRAEIQRQTNNV